MKLAAKEAEARMTGISTPLREQPRHRAVADEVDIGERMQREPGACPGFVPLTSVMDGHDVRGVLRVL
jgi:hypothetical protein